ncbi:glycosyltransferase family 1 protein [Stenotrophomonas cyclobalanopsidis]|uniref:Glycosyltransferase family 1 protein n=1 Tax=Stenotrophomonas cyclobalanopsidis TaxID=2771362 RepID=A0ABQ6T1Z7_9GAMM|nr:DUF1972 domain-containing protein [Stenotrophomonas cyclobalanopsidis]KAA8999576.1 glycosyltransferase family 1 protein [Stenotrophomonas cyclobalanopsidis]
MSGNVLRILGIRGIPAAHGGFETFAEQLSLYLVAKGWEVVVYCQEDGGGEEWRDEWRGVKRIHIPIAIAGPAGTIAFDWKANRDAANSKDLCLTLGYNTAVFSGLLRVRGVPNVINMDGIEWARAKWGPVAKTWFWLNERFGCWIGDHLVADHPRIKDHLATRVRRSKIATIAYGGEKVDSADAAKVTELGLVPNEYFTVIARPEPENSLLEIVQGFSKSPRLRKLAVLGKYDSENSYHRQVMDSASDDVVFLGAIYDKEVVQALRFFCSGYVHGHQVGGTNPSLVEALGASNPVIAHENLFNRWVAGDGARYFACADSFSVLIDEIENGATDLKSMSVASALRHQEAFTWDRILGEYENLLSAFAVGRRDGLRALAEMELE